MSNKPTVSVIIPTYNHGHLIEKCLNSLIGQTFKSWEAIIVNNFSNDNTIDVVNSFSDERIKLINFDNGGVIAAGRNKGLTIALGDYIAFLDSDDLWYEDKLEVAVAGMKDYDIFYHDLDYINKDGKTGKVMRCRKLYSPIFEDLLLHGNGLLGSSVVVKRSILDKAGGPNGNPLLFGIADFDLWIRISQVTEKFLYASKPLGCSWIGDHNLSKPSPDYVKRFRYLYSQYVDLLPKSKVIAGKAFLDYIIVRQLHRSGDLKSALDYFRIIPHVDSLQHKIKSFLFGLKFLLLRR